MICVFGVWQHIHDFVHNQRHATSFGLDHPRESPLVPFLDVSICVMQGGSDLTEIHVYSNATTTNS